MITISKLISRLRGLINKLCNKTERAKKLRKELEAKKVSKKDINAALREQVYEPCNQAIVAVQKLDVPKVAILDKAGVSKIKAVIDTYEKNYALQKESVFYDVHVNPDYYQKAFKKINECFESEGLALTFSNFPLRTSFVPCYITLDAVIIHQQILKRGRNRPTKESKFETWKIVVDLNKKAFKPQGINKSMCFQGFLQTDGVGVSIIKQNFEGYSPGSDGKSSKDDTKYIESLTREEVKKTNGKCVLMDPGRRDLLYCMKEDSTIKSKKILTYTKMTRTKLTRHHRILSKKTMPKEAQTALNVLSKTKSSSANIQQFEAYIKARALAGKILYPYYGSETLIVKKDYYPDHQMKFHVKDTGDLYLDHLFVARIKGFFPSPMAQPTESALFPVYLRILLYQKHLASRFTASELANLRSSLKKLDDIDEDESSLNRARSILKKLLLLPFRKMKFSAKIYHDKDDLELVKRLRGKFGKDAILVIGNWSAPMVKHQEPSRSKGLINMLKKNGFTVYLIDEFKTSSVCPKCEGDLENFKFIPNPRPYRRKKQPTVLCHGLLR